MFKKFIDSNSDKIPLISFFLGTEFDENNKSTRSGRSSHPPRNFSPNRTDSFTSNEGTQEEEIKTVIIKKFKPFHFNMGHVHWLGI